MVGVCYLAYLFNNVGSLVNVLAVNDNAHCVDTCGDMLEAHTVSLKNCKYSA